MPQIEVLDEQTIDKIAAGEVVERPSAMFVVPFAGEQKDAFWLCPKLVQFLPKY